MTESIAHPTEIDAERPRDSRLVVVLDGHPLQDNMASAAVVTFSFNIALTKDLVSKTEKKP